MQLLCLGSLDCFPKKGNDSASYLLDQHILIDTGWATVNNLLNQDMDPLAVETIVITHFHPDHYAGLNALFFYLLLKGRDLRDLTMVGPVEDAERMVKKAVDYWMEDAGYKAAYPKIVPVHGPETVLLSTTKGNYELKTHPSVHPVRGFCYRLSHEGISIGFSGDTLFQDALIPFFAGCDLLVYENSWGPAQVTDQRNGHSSSFDAGRTAREAAVGRLLLVHGRLEPADCVAACRSEYSGDICFPNQGDLITVVPKTD
ncbi:MAG: MBL fold metallo-hydrolase [Ruminococcaceae bacterium]|nr:MBL fold metallo-hydrolase [Oscillospiraceae bacterium]